MQKAKNKTTEARDSVKEELRGAREDVQRRAADTVNRQKHQVADRLESIVHALSAAQQSLRDDEQAQLAGYVDDLTRQVERSTGYLRNNDFSGMMRDMENLARQNTGVFLGSTFVAGMALGRFLRASEPEEEPTSELAGRSGFDESPFSVPASAGLGTSPGRSYEALGTTGSNVAGRPGATTAGSDLGVTGSPRRDVGVAGTGTGTSALGERAIDRSSTTGREYRAGELGTSEPGGATGTRGSIGAPGEGGLTGGSERDTSTRREEP